MKKRPAPARDDKRKNATLWGEIWGATAQIAAVYAVRKGLPVSTSDNEDDAEIRQFQTEVIAPLRVDPSTSGEAASKAFFADGPSAEHAYRVACAYVAQAQDEYFRADRNEMIAWSLACDARYWIGIAISSLFLASPDVLDRQYARQWAQRAARERHKENRAMKAQVFEWCVTHSGNFKSMDAMAEAVARKIVPVAVRTARGWIGEWKKMQSAGTL